MTSAGRSVSSSESWLNPARRPSRSSWPDVSDVDATARQASLRWWDSREAKLAVALRCGEYGEVLIFHAGRGQHGLDARRSSGHGHVAGARPDGQGGRTGPMRRGRIVAEGRSPLRGRCAGLVLRVGGVEKRDEPAVADGEAEQSSRGGARDGNVKAHPAGMCLVVHVASTETTAETGRRTQAQSTTGMWPPHRGWSTAEVAAGGRPARAGSRATKAAR